MVAKFNVLNCDSQVHEALKHLGMSHLLSETFAIAHHNTYNHLAEKSKHDGDNKAIGEFLRPHFTNMLGVNNLARVSLMVEVNNGLAQFMGMRG